jgi:hypothetical protein
MPIPEASAKPKCGQAVGALDRLLRLRAMTAISPSTPVPNRSSACHAQKQTSKSMRCARLALERVMRCKESRQPMRRANACSTSGVARADRSAEFVVPGLGRDSGRFVAAAGCAHSHRPLRSVLHPRP